MSNTKTRFAFTVMWLTAVLAAVTLRMPGFWGGSPATQAVTTAADTRTGGTPHADVTSQGTAERPSVSAGPIDTPLLQFPHQPSQPRTTGASRAPRRLPAAAVVSASSAAPESGLPGPAAVAAPQTEQPLADRLVLAAQAATAAGEHATAAQVLRRLAQERPLTLDESKWLAGQYDAAGNETEALVAYYAVATRAGDDAPTWERIGDLELENGRPKQAAAAYARLAPASRTSAAWVKIARASAADGQSDAALDAYKTALDSNPAEADAVSLEAARYAASVQKAERALEFYARRGASKQGAAGLHLEMAQAALAAGRPEQALRWTSAAAAAGDRSLDVRYARAQALHMTGQSDAASALLRELQAEAPDDARLLAWLARTAQAQGRHLEAYELYTEALPVDAADVLIARGDVAAQRGDTSRARADYARARVAGADERIVSERLGRLDTTPQLALPFEYLRDSNDVELTAQTARLDLWTTGPFRLAARFLTGRIRQHATAFNTQSGAIDLDNWFVTPRLSMSGSAGFAKVGAASMPAWDGTVRYAWRSGGSVALQTTRQTPWSGDPSREMMRFNRIHDLAGVGPRFDATTIGTQVTIPVGLRQAFRADVTSREYSDGNASRDLFVQFQHVIADGSTWIALQPNVYVEQWHESNPAYFSPDTHVTTGVTLRAIGQRGIWSFDTGVTPQLLSSNGRLGGGINLTAGLRARLGSGSAGANVMIFDDRRYAYGLRRVVADVRIPLGK